ncbi:MAG: GNAT superfamily N-acetyltransferase, partial [Cryomorphaceae bacterium]
MPSTKEIQNVELQLLDLNDYAELKAAMISAYKTMPDSYWKEHHISTLIKKFPDGQAVIKVDGKIAGCALCIIVDWDKTLDNHTYKDITKDYTFDSHTSKGDMLYGIDVFIKPEFRGLRLGRRLYDYRKELCETLNLKGIAFGGRIPGYHKYADKLSPKEYIGKVRLKEIMDP